MQVGVVARCQGRKVTVACAHNGAVQIVGVPIERIVVSRRPPASHIETQSVSTAVALVPDQLPQLPPPEQKAGVQSDEIDMSLLLQMIQEKFADHDRQLDVIRRTAIGGVAIKGTLAHD